MELDKVVYVCQWLIFVAGVVGFILGFLLIFARGFLEMLAGLANKVISLDKIVKFLDSVPVTLDNWIMMKSKVAGAILIIISVILIINGLPILSCR